VTEPLNNAADEHLNQRNEDARNEAGELLVAAASDPTSLSPASITKRESESWLVSAQSLFCTLVIALFVITFIAQAFQIPSQSMEDTLLIGDYLLVDKVRYGQTNAFDWLLPYYDIERGDIIVFRYPIYPSQHFVKRVVGIPGDRIHISDKQVFVNGEPVDQSFAVFRSRSFDRYRDDFPDLKSSALQVDADWYRQLPRNLVDGELLVPAGKYFVLGDNRDESLDSRYWGFVPVENVIGRPLVIYWSLDTTRSSEAADAAGDGKLLRLGHQLVNAPKNTRWNRSFRIIR
jgi:signal peptidase I